MRRYSFILFLAAIIQCGGCQSVTAPFKQSLASVAEDYRHVTSGTDSRYIAGQRSQP